MTTFYRYDEWGWYIGTVEFAHERSTPTPPTNLSLDNTGFVLRANWNGSEWIDLEYVHRPDDESGEVANQVAYLKESFEEKVIEEKHANILYLGNLYEATAEKRGDIVALLAIGVLPPGFYWYDKDDNPTALDIDQLRGLAIAIAMRDMSIYEKLAAKTAALYACTTLAEVAAIGWDD